MFYIPRYNDEFYYSADPFSVPRWQNSYEAARRRAMERQYREDMMRRRLQREELARHERERERYLRHFEMERELARRDALLSQHSDYINRGDDDRCSIVRGPDGRLYRLHRNSPGNTASRGDAGIQKQNSKAKPDDNKEKSFDDSRQKESEPEVTQEIRGARAASSHTISTKQEKRNKKPSIVVEDVSDSESELDSSNSFWRNRHPSPDESWMEPVAISF